MGRSNIPPAGGEYAIDRCPTRCPTTVARKLDARGDITEAVPPAIRLYWPSCCVRVLSGKVFP